VDQHGIRRENPTAGPEERGDNDIHSRIKRTTEGNVHPREDEERTGYEEPAGKVEGYTGGQASKTGSARATTVGSRGDNRKTTSIEGED
jgi:hypothetical protein